MSLHSSADCHDCGVGAFSPGDIPGVCGPGRLTGSLPSVHFHSVVLALLQSNTFG